MNKTKTEKILPVPVEHNKSKEKKQESNFTLSDMLQVNAITNKTPTSKKRTDKIPPLSNDKIKNLQVTTKSPQKYVNYKQECFHRLSRESKLKDNEKIAELLMKKSSDKKSSTKNAKEVKKEISTSSNQQAQLNSILDAKKKLSKKNVYTTKNNTALKKTPSAKMKHICSKALYSDEVHDVDSMMKYFDKHMNTNEMLMKPNSSELLKVERKTSNNSKLDNCLETYNSKLKNKFLNNVYERNKYDTLLKKPTFRSIKELLQINKNDFATIEASMGKKDNLDLALEDFIDNVSETSNECDDKINQEDSDILGNHRFYDYLEDMNKEEIEDKTLNRPMTEASKQELYSDIDKIINKYRSQKEKGIKTTETDTKSIATNTNDNEISKLCSSIMKSDYLMKEFNMAPVKQTIVANKVATSSKLSEDLKYLLK
ncbi:hypothetical protein CBL_00436 [Carabus blaptoides fortunei]